ncbi:MAG: hypothetical protein HC906_03265 [Bacteroidales bacterium]|nr:hypothetical protein [Bacteroidales bacterium]
MEKDVWPASRLGIRTVLFAGDKRSLRLKAKNINLNGLKPDFVITDLQQIFEIVGI